MDEVEFEALRTRLDHAIRQAHALRDKLRATRRDTAAPVAVILPFKARQERQIATTNH